ncbi:retrovirus-related Pol polyprotein from transposon 17.6 [Trichonephila clavipes]|nr:retrovirus-related Pol polyprotein from transposon 17.6 [Trichonephila clavipes]
MIVTITLLDLTNGYWQILLTPKAQRLAAFTTSFETYRPLRMPFGLKNAPYYFSRLMAELLQGWLGKRSPAQLKVQTILDFPVPRTKSQIRAFLGIAGYYRQYIPMFSSLAAPLTELLKGKSKKGYINWTSECQESFVQLKEKLSTNPVLYAPDFKRQFILQTDASDTGIGIVWLREMIKRKSIPSCTLARNFLTPRRITAQLKRVCSYRLCSKNLIVTLMDSRNLSFRPTITHYLAVNFRNQYVTGTTCAPYLATRTIQQLARDEGEHYPLAASVTIRDIYMDDILTEEQSWDFHCQSSDQKTIKTLGIIWSPQFDYFSFKTVVNCRESYTKREVLSIIARLFDPLGFLGPILTKAKLILQKLWVLKLEWDEPLSKWNDFVSTLPVIQNIHVPRLVIGKGRIIIHGFADASTAAYGAVLYAQSISEKDVSTRLFLVQQIPCCTGETNHYPSFGIVCLCVIVITPGKAWIQRSPEQLKTFIGNRIKIIERLTQNCQWNHVSSNENPADLISRGLNASDISSKQLWWHGPDFLREELEANPIDFERITSDSDYLKELKPENCKRPGQLDYSEVNEAELCLIKNLQASAFQEEIEFLAKSSCNSKKGKLFSLNPFLDGNQILRVGGRLQNSDLTYSQKHPAILPADHLLTKLIMINIHNRNFHLGPQALLYCTRQRFWPLSGRSIARKIVHECVVCFKNKPIVANQLMGSLPRERVNPSFPFLHTGIDYCVPFFIRYKHQRKGTYQKIYVAIFVCLASKAVHLEIVSDLTTDAFLATLKRFVARRGKCATISSDNAKNFVGANRELKRLHNLLKFSEEKLSYLFLKGISWNFMPPRAPNFVGLWEAGVKSFKFYLKKL